MKYNYLAFEGGGVFGIAYLGALRYLEEHGHLSKIRGFAGTSVGAIVALLCACGYTVEQMRAVLRKMPLRLLADDRIGVLRDILHLWFRWGWCEGKALYRWLENIVLAQVPTNRFCDLPHQLRVVATNVNTGSPVIFPLRHDETVADKVYMSAAVPLFFPPRKYHDEYYVDGGMLKNFPIDAFDDVEHTLGFLIVSQKEMEIATTERTEIQNFSQYNARLLRLLLQNCQRAHIRQEWFAHAVKIVVPPTIHFLKFQLSPHEMEHLEQLGYEAIRTHFEKLLHVEKPNPLKQG